MRIYLARHGQPALENMAKGSDYELPDGDYVLTALGREQAALLGKRLKEMNFSGKVFSSPYARTMETASIAAAVCGLDVHPEPRMQEMRFAKELPCPGMTLEEIKANYPNIAPDAVLPYPWLLPDGPEEVTDVRNRVFPYVEELIAAPPAEEILLVGHGASVGAIKHFMITKAAFTGCPGYNWNASLCTFDVDANGNVTIVELNTIDFMPIEKVTSNKRLYGDPECV